MVGLGHALTLVVLGIPILLFQQALRERLQALAGTALAAVIVFLATRLYATAFRPARPRAYPL